MLRDSRRNRSPILLVAAIFLLTGCNLGQSPEGTSTPVVATNPSIPSGSATTVLPEGLVKWQVKLSDRTMDDGLVVDEGTAYVMTRHDNPADFRNVSPCLYAFDVQTGAKKWAFTYSGNQASSPTVSNGLVFFTVSQPLPDLPEHRGSYLYALDATTGKEKWHFQAGSLQSGQPLVEDRIVYFATLKDADLTSGSTGLLDREPYIHAFRANTGELIWKEKINADIWPAATIDKGTLYFVEQIKYEASSKDFYIKALDLGTQNTKWQFKISEPYLSVDKLVVANDMVYFSSRYRDSSRTSYAQTGQTRYRDSIRALDTATGKVRWFYSLDIGQGVGRHGIGGAIGPHGPNGSTSSPGSCCMFSLSKAQKQVEPVEQVKQEPHTKEAAQLAFSIQASTVYTSYPYPVTGLNTFPEVAGDTLLVGLGLMHGTPDSNRMWGDMDGYVLGLDAFTGEERWRTNVQTTLYDFLTLIVKKETAYLVAITAIAPWEPHPSPVSLYALDTRSGSILWEKPLDRLRSLSSIGIDDDMMIAAGWRGDVYAIPLPTASP